MTKNTVLVLATLFWAATVAAQTGLGDFERILIPIVADHLPGAFGSSWTTEFRARHESNVDVVVGYDNGDDPRLIPPHSTYMPRLFARITGEPEGQFILIRRSATSTSYFSLRLRDESRNTKTAGVSVPIVRENQLLRGPHYLLGIPAGGGFRRTLRVYDASGRESEFDVRAFDDREQNVVGSAHISLTPSTRFFSENVPMRPASFTADVDYLFPTLPAYQYVTIEITPHVATQEWWAFVSVTNNQTQEVTMVVP
jgi:hypothetical protein